MIIKKYKTVFQAELSTFYDELEVESFFYIILNQFHNLKRIDLALQPELSMKSSELERWENVVVDLKLQKPIQYILGETEFYGLRFLVDASVLIPRPETEELVRLIVESRKSKVESLTILDIGTGSGCIAISLAKNVPNASVFALDVSEAALARAKKNAEINEASVTFIGKNILEIDDLEQQFDIIVSNPPYVRMLEKAEIKTNVLDFEPHLALFVQDDDALLFYRKIAQLAKKNLVENGKLYFEINQYLGEETTALLAELGFNNIKLHKDIYECDRMISCSLQTEH